MTVPGEAALRFLWGLALGALMGIVYEFLRPLRRRRNAPADLLFVLFCLWVWIWYGFQICAGDIRLGGTAALGLGAMALIFVFGKPLRGLFFPFWRGSFQIFGWIFAPLKKIFKKNSAFFEKSICIWQKKGYNRMDKASAFSALLWRTPQ